MMVLEAFTDCQQGHFRPGCEFEKRLDQMEVRCAFFDKRYPLEVAIGSHACLLEVTRRVANGIPLGRPLSYRFTLYLCVQSNHTVPMRPTTSLKVHAKLFLASGWAPDSLYVYIIDEISNISVNLYARNTSALIKNRLPFVKVVATGDGVFGVALNISSLRKGGNLEFVDVLIPRMHTYAGTDPDAIAAIRAEGKKVGWYTSGDPDGPYSLNTFVECGARFRI
jgi:hypothetical protein